MSLTHMEEDLTCPVCLELYADPLMMPCSHSVCKTCLLDIMRSRNKSEKQTLECPTCRTTHDIKSEQLDNLPKNLALENIVFRFQEIQSINMSKDCKTFSDCTSPTSPKPFDDIACESVSDADTSDDVFNEYTDGETCGMCEPPHRSKAIWSCDQCQVNYCQLCLDTFHPSRGTLREHKVLRFVSGSAKGSSGKCQDHSSEHTSIFCDTCKTVACHLCVCEGQGRHCGHTILDIDTAMAQLKNVLTKATQDLNSLSSRLRDKQLNISLQLENLKTLKHKSESAITNHYQILMSDIQAALDMARNDTMNNTSCLLNTRMTHLTQHNHSLQSTVTQCQDLLLACQSISDGEVKMVTDKPKDIEVKGSPHHEQKVKRSTDDFSGVHNAEIKIKQSKGPSNSKSKDVKDRVKPVKLTDTLVVDTGSQNLTLTGSEPVTFNPSDIAQASSPVSVCSPSPSETKSHKTVQSKNKTPRAKKLEEKKDSIISKADVLKDPIEEMETNLTSTSIKSIEQSTSKKSLDLSSDSTPMDGSTLLEENIESNSKSRLEKKKTMKYRMKNQVKNDMSLSSLKGEAEDALGEMNEARQSQTTANCILLRADEVWPILEQVSLLCKETSYTSTSNDSDITTELSGADDTFASSENTVRKAVVEAFQCFQIKSLDIIHNLTASDSSPVEVVTPAVRSVMSPAPGMSELEGSAGSRRVQSRTLISWGFNSTTFSADPVTFQPNSVIVDHVSPDEGIPTATRAVQWQVTVNRNRSQIGDVMRQGYLFGVGVARRCLASKEQVGMGQHSYGIVCNGGTVSFCHGGHMTSLCDLGDLPITVTLSLRPGKGATGILHYRVSRELNQSSGQDYGDINDICGRRLISKTDYDNDSSKMVEDSRSKKTEWKCESYHPVFTVSQRVKLQFSQPTAEMDF